MAKKIILFFLIVLTVGLDSTLIPSFLALRAGFIC